MTDYIVPVSGGKDSQLVLKRALAKHLPLGDRVRAVHQFTGHDHPLTLKHLKYIEQRYCVHVEFTKSAKYADVPEFIERAGYFPASNARGCTTELKIKPFIAWLRKEGYTAEPGRAHIYFGMRAAESVNREAKYGELRPDDVYDYGSLTGFKYGKDLKNVALSMPIVDMQTQAVFEELRRAGDQINPLYARGHSRVGCYPCLLAGREEWELAVGDEFGKGQIKKFLDTEQKFVVEKNHRKLIKIHEKRDVKYLYEHGRFPDHQRRGLDTQGGCGLFCEPEEAKV